MKNNFIKNLLNKINYDVVFVPKKAASKKVLKINIFVVKLVIIVSFVIFYFLITLLIINTNLSSIYPFKLYYTNPDSKEFIELRNKVSILSEEVQRVKQINERLKLIIEGKPIPIDPRDLDTIYQIQKKQRDSLKVLGKYNLRNNLFEIFLAFYKDNFLNHFQSEKEKSDQILYFIKPTDGIVTKGFSKEFGHLGIDFAVPVGTPVRASASGIVVFADYTINDGYKIIISHQNGYITIYKHLSKPLKRERDFVKQGEIIALSGNTGRLTTGPHLHFEIWKFQTPIDPKQILMDLK